jgi:hypothetical protein
MLDNVSMGVKLAIGLGCGIAVWGLLRWLIHLVNKTSVEMNMVRSDKKPSQKQILKNVMNSQYD